jgi:hypothetical protein
MGVLVFILLFLVTVAIIAGVRFVQRRGQLEARTREWLEFLQEDLAASL